MENEKKLTTEDLAEKMLELMGRDHGLRQGYLEHNKAKLKHARFRTYGLIAAITGPFLFYILLYMGIVTASWFGGDRVALVSISGIIHAEKTASAQKILPALKEAFEDRSSIGVVIRINSPGGSPVQSDLIYGAIKDLRIKYPEKRVIMIAEDSVASGAYWIAMSGDKLYVNESSAVGSIGVISEGFGINLEEFLGEYGIERRVVTAGDNKLRYDMFSPEKPEDLKKIRSILEKVHDNFKQRVIEGRGDRIKVDHSVAFSGDYWIGSEAVEMGLADGIGSVQSVVLKEFGISTVVDYSVRPTFYDNIGKTFGSQSTEAWYLDIVSFFTGHKVYAM